MSDTPLPETTRGTMSRDLLRGLTGSWWLFLVLGVFWILFGMFVLSYNVGSVLALAVFAGLTFLMTGVTQLITAGRAESWRWLYVVGGILSIIAGILAFGWPGRTVLVLAGILAWFLVFKGIVDVVGSLASIGRSWWWLTLILGVLELLLGIWAAGYPGRSLFVFVNLVGIYAISDGFTEIFAAFDLHALRDRIDRPPAERPAQ
jgi:uncharacterized membrane protein HdeD (DUF308 family)